MSPRAVSYLRTAQGEPCVTSCSRTLLLYRSYLRGRGIAWPHNSAGITLTRPPSPVPPPTRRREHGGWSGVEGRGGGGCDAQLDLGVVVAARSANPERREQGCGVHNHLAIVHVRRRAQHRRLRSAPCVRDWVPEFACNVLATRSTHQPTSVWGCGTTGGAGGGHRDHPEHHDRREQGGPPRSRHTHPPRSTHPALAPGPEI